jgi:L-lysine exporter family protein LysE/ArgO
MLLGSICVIYISISLIRTTPDKIGETKIDDESILKIFQTFL